MQNLLPRPVGSYRTGPYIPSSYLFPLSVCDAVALLAFTFLFDSPKLLLSVWKLYLLFSLPGIPLPLLLCLAGFLSSFKFLLKGQLLRKGYLKLPIQSEPHLNIMFHSLIVLTKVHDEHSHFYMYDCVLIKDNILC